MFETMVEGFRSARDSLRGKATLTAENIAPAVEMVRKSLLEADVEYGVVQEFLEAVRQRTLGTDVQLHAGSGADRRRASPSDHFIKVCHEQLTQLMGEDASDLRLPKHRPAVILMVGLQGSGKTTTSGKLARHLATAQERSPLLVAADTYRPAAIEQLRQVGSRIDIPVWSREGLAPPEIARTALEEARNRGYDLVIIDSAGRLAIDERLMTELDEIKKVVTPDHIFLVVDAMMGQDALRTAEAFHHRLSLTGIVMTKLDGDARGGAALSIRRHTGVPLRFLGTGEKSDNLEVFRAEGLAGRILGLGDVVGLMEDFERVSTQDQAAMAEKMLRGQFNLRDFYEQVSMIQRMGSLTDLAAKLPLGSMMPQGAKLNLDDRELVRIKAMIDSMTEKERLQPAILNDSRIRRVARGSGRSQKEVQDLIKKFSAMRQMMSLLGGGMGGGMLGKIPGLGNLAKLNSLRKAAASGGGGLGDLSQLGALMGSGDRSNGVEARRSIDRDKLRRARKAAKDARKKNRR